jgi:hypothetical protein
VCDSEREKKENGTEMKNIYISKLMELINFSHAIKALVQTRISRAHFGHIALILLMAFMSIYFNK